MLKKEWNKILDKYLKTGEIHADEYEQLDIMQEMVIQELKKAYARLKEPDTSAIDPISKRDCSQREGIPF